MTAGITGCVLDKDFFFFIDHSTVAENNIGHIAYTLVVIRGNEVAARLGNNTRRIIQIRSEGV
ncbi:hypothetical protein D3C76_1733840 [compost metagenome]